jgi:hypothetical protein
MPGAFTVKLLRSENTALSVLVGNCT